VVVATLGILEGLPEVAEYDDGDQGAVPQAVQDPPPKVV